MTNNTTNYTQTTTRFAQAIKEYVAISISRNIQFAVGKIETLKTNNEVQVKINNNEIISAKITSLGGEFSTLNTKPKVNDSVLVLKLSGNKNIAFQIISNALNNQSDEELSIKTKSVQITGKANKVGIFVQKESVFNLIHESLKEITSCLTELRDNIQNFSTKLLLATSAGSAATPLETGFLAFNANLINANADLVKINVSLTKATSQINLVNNKINQITL